MTGHKEYIYIQAYPKARFTYGAAAYTLLGLFLCLVVSAIAIFATAAESALFFNQFMSIFSNVGLLLIAITALSAIGVAVVTMGTGRKEWP
jgi:hypothetical protein